MAMMLSKTLGVPRPFEKIASAQTIRKKLKQASRDIYRANSDCHLYPLKSRDDGCVSGKNNII